MRELQDGEVVGLQGLVCGPFEVRDVIGETVTLDAVTDDGERLGAYVRVVDRACKRGDAPVLVTALPAYSPGGTQSTTCRCGRIAESMITLESSAPMPRTLPGGLPTNTPEALAPALQAATAVHVPRMCPEEALVPWDQLEPGWTAFFLRWTAEIQARPLQLDQSGGRGGQANTLGVILHNAARAACVDPGHQIRSDRIVSRPTCSSVAGFELVRGTYGRLATLLLLELEQRERSVSGDRRPLLPVRELRCSACVNNGPRLYAAHISGRTTC